MKRCIALLSCFIMAKGFAYTQLVNNGATITVTSGAAIKCTGNIINNGGGTIQNSGIVSSDGEIRNEATSILGGSTGVYEATTKFVNNGVAFTGLKLRLIGSSNTDSIKSGAGSTYDSVILAKGAGTTATLSDAMTVNGGILFNNDNNKLILEDENLIMGVSAKFANPDNNQFVITNSTGTITKQSLGPATSPATFVYPVGFSATEFNPLTIANNGTADNISVRCLQNVLANGTSGAALTSDFANNSWVVTEATPNGSNLTLTGEWTVGDELTDFNRLKTGIARFNTGTDWDLLASNVIAASGSGPYSRTISNMTSTGVFAVADLDKVNAALLNIKIFLQGPYNSTNGTHNDALRTTGLIPTTQPYSSAMSAVFTRLGVYDGSASVNETVPNATKFDLPGTNDDIIDWVYISLQDGTTPATKLQTRAALLKRDGNIVEYNAVSDSYGPVRMPIDANGNYHLIVAHRNHLPIRTATTQSLQDNIVTSYNFTTSQAQAFQNPAVTGLTPPNNNPAMKALTGGVFGMWAGNVNINNNVRFFGLNNDASALVGALGGNQALALSVYSPADINMDGLVRFFGLNNDAAALVAVLSGNQAAVYTQH